ncbi:MAG: hypothetical protein GXP04_07195 [Alphaproteobacteria bacterium]|nr:hypothetical protein [Alphaproteobacteria bacterium]
MRNALIILSIGLLSAPMITAAIGAQRGIKPSKSESRSEDSDAKILNVQALQSGHDKLGVIPKQISVSDMVSNNGGAYSGTYWEVYPLHVGSLFNLQIGGDGNGDTGPARYRNSIRSMTLSIFNPSIKYTASVTVKCGGSTLIDSKIERKKEVAMNSFWSLTVSPKNRPMGDAACIVSSADVPITVAAIVVNTILEDGTPEYGGDVIHHSAVEWPVFRTNGAD